jgi:hypothetical protein
MPLSEQYRSSALNPGPERLFSSEERPKHDQCWTCWNSIGIFISEIKYLRDSNSSTFSNPCTVKIFARLLAPCKVRKKLIRCRASPGLNMFIVSRHVSSRGSGEKGCDDVLSIVDLGRGNQLYRRHFFGVFASRNNVGNRMILGD